MDDVCKISKLELCTCALFEHFKVHTRTQYDYLSLTFVEPVFMGENN